MVLNQPPKIRGHTEIQRLKLNGSINSRDQCIVSTRSMPQRWSVQGVTKQLGGNSNIELLISAAVLQSVDQESVSLYQWFLRSSLALHSVGVFNLPVD